MELERSYHRSSSLMSTHESFSTTLAHAPEEVHAHATMELNHPTEGWWRTLKCDAGKTNAA